MSENLDLVIVGSGPGGYVAAIRAAQLGLSVGIVEKDERFGGTCLLRGCIPTKSMLESAELADHARHSAKFGVDVGSPSVDLGRVVDRAEKVVSQNAGGVAFLLKKNKVATFRGVGRLLGGGQVEVSPASGPPVVLRAKHIILATGSVPRRLPHLEVDGEVILSSDELLKGTVMPSHLLVLGAGAVGVEFASVFRSFGCDVTVVELQDRLVPFEDEDVSAEFAKVFRRRGVKVHTSTKLAEVERLEQGVRARLEGPDGKSSSVTASHLLVAVGRAPVTEGVGLENTAAKLDRGFVLTDGYGATDEPGLFAIGDIVAGTPQLAHAASAEGIRTVEHIAGLEPPQIDYRQCPGATYSNPEIGSLGLTERQAREAGHEVKVGTFPFTALGKAKVIDSTAGFVKIVAEAKYNQILGVHIIGPKATELIAQAGLMLRLECTLEELARTIHAHPTLSEGVMEAAHAALGHAIHL